MIRVCKDCRSIVPPDSHECLDCGCEQYDSYTAPKSIAKGQKHDTGKLRWDLLPIKPVEEVVRVLSHGAEKYGDDENWKEVPDAQNRYYAAMLRHIVAWRKGELVDPDSGMHHLANATCCALFLMWFDWKEVGQSGTGIEKVG